MAEDIGIRLIYDNSVALSAMDETLEKLQAMQKENDVFNKDLNEKNKLTAKQFEELNKYQGEAVDGLREAVTGQKAARQELKQTIGDYKIFGTSINDVRGKLNGYLSHLRNSTVAMGGMTKAAKVLRVALISTGIGAIVVALASLTTLLTKTQKGMDFMSKAGAALGAVFGNVKDIFISLGDGLVKFFTGDFKGAFAALNNAGKEFVDIGYEAKRAWELEGLAQSLRDRTLEFRSQAAVTSVAIKQLYKDADDLSLSSQERAEKALQAGRMVEEQLERERQLILDEIYLEEERQRQNESVIKDTEKLVELEEKLASIEIQSLQTQLRLQNKANAAIRQSIAEREALLKSYKDAVKEMQKILLDLELEQLDPVAKLEKQREVALAGLATQEAELIKIARKLGKPIDDVRKSFEKVVNLTNLEFDKAIREEMIKPVAELPDRVRGPLQELYKELDEAKRRAEVFGIDTSGVQAQIQAQIDKEKDGLFKIPKATIEFKTVDVPTTTQRTFIDAFASLFDSIEEVLGSEMFQNLFNGAQTFFNSYAGLLTESLNLEIAEYTKLADEKRALREDLEDELERQQEREEEGLANSLAATKRNLAEAKKAEEAALKEREAREKKAQRLQIIQDSVSQGSNLVTASTNIWKAWTPLGPAGYVAAIAAIGTMFALFAKTKADALKATRLYKGGKLSDHMGFIDRQGESDIPGRGDGYDVSLKGRPVGIKLSGREFINTEETSHDHWRFLTDLNKKPNKYKNYDLMEMFNRPAPEIFSPTLSKATTVIYQKELITDPDVLKELKAVRQELAEIKKKKVVYTVGKDTEKVVFVDDKGNVVIERV